MAKLVSAAVAILALALSSCSDVPEVDATADNLQPVSTPSIVAPDGSVLEPFDTLAFADVETQNVEFVASPDLPSIYLDVPVTWEESAVLGWALDPKLGDDSPTLFWRTFSYDEFLWDDAHIETATGRYSAAGQETDIKIRRYVDGSRTYEIATIHFPGVDATVEQLDVHEIGRGFSITWAVEDNSLYEELRPQVLTALRSVQFGDDDD